jgi:hypothetical protein
MKSGTGDYGIPELKRKLTAKELQRYEALFIHALTDICAANGIEVQANEQNGLTTDSEIQEALCLEAAQQIGVPAQCFTLVLKPFVDPKVLEEYQDSRALTA